MELIRIKIGLEPRGGHFRRPNLGDDPGAGIDGETVAGGQRGDHDSDGDETGACRHAPYGSAASVIGFDGMMLFMPGLDRESLKVDLRRLIATECERDVEAAGVDDDDALIGGSLALDSLDVLQICVEVRNRYGVRIEGGPEARRALESINTLADTILSAESELSTP